MSRYSLVRMLNQLPMYLRTALLAAMLLLSPLALGCNTGGGGGGGGGNGGGGGGGGGGTTPLVLPAQGDWTDRGMAVNAGASVGVWDYVLEGAISPAGIIKRGGTYFLYYIGGDGFRASDNGTRHRALGVATSSDGLNFTKFAGNPIVENLPTSGNDEEEGIFSAAVVLDGSNNFVLYYGALQATSPSSTSVFSDVRRATSSDGLNFSPVPGPIVLDHGNGAVWNSGDELYPIGVYRNGSTFNLYYTSQGSVANFALGMATGTTSSFSSTQGLITPGNSNQQIIGGGDVVPDTPSSFLFFTMRSFANRVIEVREVQNANPAQIGSPIASYSGFPNVQQFTVLLDEDVGNWFLYISEFGFIRVYTADIVRM